MIKEFQRVYKAKDENIEYEKQLNAELNKLHKSREKYMDTALPYEENIALTKKVVDYAHQFGVTVEGELGVLAGVEDAI